MGKNQMALSANIPKRLSKNGFRDSNGSKSFEKKYVGK